MTNYTTAKIQEIEARLHALCSERGINRLLVLTDSNVAPLLDHLSTPLLPSSGRLTVKAGEASKSLECTMEIWRFMIEHGALRNSALVNIGGGMITDLGGFAASTFNRGISHINLPTTLLAAIDAAIGGKTGINFEGLKNKIGTFALPLAVMPLTFLFDSLPEEEWLSGVGEAIKTGLLAGEPLFELTTSDAFIIRRDPVVVDEVVKRCVAFKNRVVEEDFREKGRRRILNLGHTWGHALEEYMLAQSRPLPHGIAVAHGLLETLRRSHLECGLPEDLLKRYEQILKKYFPPIVLTEDDRRKIESYTLHDKKNTHPGKAGWVLLRDIGRPL